MIKKITINIQFNESKINWFRYKFLLYLIKKCLIYILKLQTLDNRKFDYSFFDICSFAFISIDFDENFS